MLHKTIVLGKFKQMFRPFQRIL